MTVRRGGQPVVSAATFDIPAGALAALIGPSGAGKTTVLRALAGLDPLDSGAVCVAGIQLSPGLPPRGECRRQLARRVGFVFQAHHLFSHLSAIDNVALALVHVTGLSRELARRRAAVKLEDLGVAARAQARPHELSGGESQRVAIARALVLEPQVLLMDEPTASLDPTRRDELAQTLLRLSRAGRTILLATHDHEFTRACADHVIRMEAGRVTAAGPPAGHLAR